MDLNRASKEQMETKFRRMLLGRLPDFGYGCNLVVTEPRSLWEYLYESIKESPTLEMCRNVRSNDFMGNYVIVSLRTDQRDGEIEGSLKTQFTEHLPEEEERKLLDLAM